MKERPILFSAPMVRAILAGTKTQTRRVIKDQLIGDRFCEVRPEGAYLEWLGAPCCGTGVWDVPEHSGIAKIPYGVPGDRLWLRETWGAHFIWDDVPPSEIPNDGKACLFYRADGFSTGWCYQTQRDKWRPSIHMPRWASRILLEIVSVRVERLQEISEADAMAEGIAHAADCGNGPIYHPSDEFVGTPTCNPVYAYGQLWEQINGREGPVSWAANPWVWVVEFKRVAQ